MKGNVDVKYCEDTNLEDVKCRTDDEFDSISTENSGAQVERIIHSCDQVDQKFAWEIIEDDEKNGLEHQENSEDDDGFVSEDDSDDD